MHFVWGKWWPEVMIHTDFQVMANGSSAWSRAWKDQDGKTGNKDVWGWTRHVDGVCNGHTVCGSFWPTSMLSRKCEWQQQKHWISRWIGWLIQWMPVSLSHLNLAKSFMNEWISHSSLTWWAASHQGRPSYYCCWVPDHQLYRAMPRPQYGAISQGHTQPFGVKFIILDLFYPGGGNNSPLLEKIHIPIMGWP